MSSTSTASAEIEIQSAGDSTTSLALPEERRDDLTPTRPVRLDNRPLSSGQTPPSEDARAVMILLRDVGVVKAGDAPTPAASVECQGDTWTLRTGASEKGRRSCLWDLVAVYERQETDDIYALCRICAAHGITKWLFLKGGVPGNGTKHFETVGKGKAAAAVRSDHLLGALYLSKNQKGGPKTKEMAADGTITRFMRPADRRDRDVRFVLMQIMTSSAYAFAQDEYVRSFLEELRVQYRPPALGTVAHHLTELASNVASSLSDIIVVLKEGYQGVRWAHVATDLWTARHSSDSYGALTVRFLKPKTMITGERSLGVGRCSGRHNHRSVRAWLDNRLSPFGLKICDVAPSTTDFGANARKKMLGLSAAWIPCAAHSLHLAVRHALGGTGQSKEQRRTREAAS